MSDSNINGIFEEYPKIEREKHKNGSTASGKPPRAILMAFLKSMVKIKTVLTTRGWQIATFNSEMEQTNFGKFLDQERFEIFLH